MPPTLCFNTTAFADFSKSIKMSGGGQQYCLRWNNHSSNFITVFDQLLRTEAFTDVTVLVNDGRYVKCHKMVLASCSAYFKKLFTVNPCEHMNIVLSDVGYNEIRAILEYMYKGEVNIAQDQLPGLLKVASFLKVKGLVEDTDINCSEESENTTSPPPSISTSLLNVAPHSSGYTSPTPHTPSSSFIPYGKSPVDKKSSGHMGLWSSLSSVPLPQHPISGHQPPTRNQHSILGTSYDIPSETSPLRRKKISAHMANRDTPILRNVLGQSQADSSQEFGGAHLEKHDASFCNNSNGSAHDSDRRNSAEFSESMMEEDDKSAIPQYPVINKPSAIKPEWKRYKQYTREHIQDAMAAVSNKEMSALQAARKFGVPSRTLYDKLKKAGILPSRVVGVSRSRESSTGQQMNTDSARFPYPSSMNGSIYGSSALSESESDAGLGNGQDLVMDMSTRSPSPVARHAPAPDRQAPAPDRQAPASDDQVEDLSVAKSSGSTAANNAPTEIVKEEEQEPAVDMV